MAEFPQLDESMKKLDITPEACCGFYLMTEPNGDNCLQERSRCAKAFREPEFVKLFKDYLDEISDPKNLKVV